MDKSHPIGQLLLDFQRLLADFFTKSLKETQHNKEDAYMDKNLIKGKKMEHMNKSPILGT